MLSVHATASQTPHRRGSYISGLFGVFRLGRVRIKHRCPAGQIRLNKIPPCKKRTITSRITHRNQNPGERLKFLFGKGHQLLVLNLTRERLLAWRFARGALRLFLARTEKKQDNRLKEVDISLKESLNELDVQLTANE